MAGVIGFIARYVIPLGAGFVVWTGIGAAGTAILGVLLCYEPV
jgi:quaternary ammonium compound-resistance protein SugE